MSVYPQYVHEEPRMVEAYRWEPDNEEATKAILWWLIRRRAKFQCEATDEVINPRSYVAFWSVSQACYAWYAYPGDWIVREGPRSFTVVEDEGFEIAYRRNDHV